MGSGAAQQRQVMAELNGRLRAILLAGVLYACLTATAAVATRVPGNRSSGKAWMSTSWTDAHATFYGGDDGSGTMGGSCGYGNLYSTGYGTTTTALSNALFNNGLSCGSCFQIVCKVAETTWCYPGRSITVTATNLCPQGSFGGWCDAPKQHFDLSYMMFTQLAQAAGGAVPVQYKRVSCLRQGGVRFTVDGNPWFIQTLITNVAAGGNVKAVSIKGSSTDWIQTIHSWGALWEADSHPELVGQSLSYLLTCGAGSVREFDNIAPSNWGYGQTYEAPGNFY